MVLVKINISELENVRSQISRLSNQTFDCANKVTSVRNNLDMEIKAKQDILQSLDRIKREMQQHSSSLKAYSNVLNDVINNFVSEDKKHNNLMLHNLSYKINTTVAEVANKLLNDPIHTGVMYGWQIQQGLLKLNEMTNVFSKSSLVEEETGFWDSFWKDTKNTVKSIGDTTKSLYGNVVKSTKDCVSWVKNSYDEKGIVYTVSQYGKAAMKIAGGLGAAGVAVASIPVSYGSTTPIAIAALGYGLNDAISGMLDVVEISYALKNNGIAEVEEVNLFKEGMQIIGSDVGNVVGSVFGNAELGEEIGEKIGEGVYGIGKITTSVYTISTAWDNIIQADDFNLSGIASETKDALKGIGDLFTKVEFKSVFGLTDDVAYQVKLLSQSIPNITNASKNISLIGTLVNNVAGDSANIIKAILNGNPGEAGGIVGETVDFVKDIFN